jgi:hypothetical protein
MFLSLSTSPPLCDLAPSLGRFSRPIPGATAFGGAPSIAVALAVPVAAKRLPNEVVELLALLLYHFGVVRPEADVLAILGVGLCPRDVSEVFEVLEVLLYRVNKLLSTPPRNCSGFST